MTRPGRDSLSIRATRILREIVHQGRALTVLELVGTDLADKPAVYGSIIALERRGLVRIQEGRVAPTRRGSDLLKTAFYRDRGAA